MPSKISQGWEEFWGGFFGFYGGLFKRVSQSVGTIWEVAEEVIPIVTLAGGALIASYVIRTLKS